MTEIIIGHGRTPRNRTDGRSCVRVFVACFVACWLAHPRDARGPGAGCGSGDRCALGSLCASPDRPRVLGAGGPQAVLLHLSQRAGESRRPGARHARLRPCRARRRDVGEGGAEDSHRDDAAQRRAPAGAKRARRLRVGSRNPSRQGGPGRHGSRGARAAPPQSRRVRQRGPRSARAGRRRRGAAAVRRLERGIRQHRRSAGRVAITRPGVRVGGDEDQPPGGRRSDADADPGHLPGARRAGAGPPHRGSAARHARRHARPPHVSARRGVRAQRHGGGAGGGRGGGGAASTSRSMATSSR